MKPFLIVRFAIPLLLLLSSGCGGSGPRQSPNGLPPAPTSADAWFGTAGNVLVSDATSDKDGKIDFLWIGFNSPTEWQKFLANPNGLQIGGTVVSPASNGLNFYFDPGTTTAAEAGIPEIQTLIDNLKADPTQTNLFDHTHRWLITVKVEQIK
ncbi:MAG TPA: hypothetical protein VGK21_08990 [Candidatus Angelobacter sp.]|jgi:hypothetical protein